jgi:DNA-binding transcriptional regulator/RsmH inhibitor MraZ
MDSCGLFCLPSTNNPLVDDGIGSESDFIVIGQIEYIEIWEKKVWEEARKRWVIDCFDEDFNNKPNKDFAE